MDTVRDGLRAGDLEKDVFDRLICSQCDRSLGKHENPGEVGSIRSCAGCKREWREIR